MRRLFLPKMAIGLVAVLVLGALVAGCGGGGGSSSDQASTTDLTDITAQPPPKPPSQPLTRAEFREKAKALCNASREKYVGEAFLVLRRLERESSKSRKKLEAEIIPTLFAVRMEERLDDVRALGIPTGDEAQVEQILAAVEEVVQEAKENPTRYLSRQWQYKHPYHHANELAKKYGISACAVA